MRITKTQLIAAAIALVVFASLTVTFSKLSYRLGYAEALAYELPKHIQQGVIEKPKDDKTPKQTAQLFMTPDQLYGMINNEIDANEKLSHASN